MWWYSPHPEIIQELSSYGKRARLGTGFQRLGKSVFARSGTEPDEFYIIPGTLLPLLEHSLQKELTLPTFNHDEIRVEDDRTLKHHSTFHWFHWLPPPKSCSINSTTYLHKKTEKNQYILQLWSQITNSLILPILSLTVCSHLKDLNSINPKIIDECFLSPRTKPVWF